MTISQRCGTWSSLPHPPNGSGKHEPYEKPPTPQSGRPIAYSSSGPAPDSTRNTCARSPRKVIATDFSPAMLRKLGKKLSDVQNVTIQRADINNFTLKNGYEVIVAIGVSEHVRLASMLKVFSTSNADRAIYSVPTTTNMGLFIRLMYRVFGVHYRLYSVKEVEDTLSEFSDISCQIVDVEPFVFLSHQAMILHLHKNGNGNGGNGRKGIGPELPPN